MGLRFTPEGTLTQIVVEDQASGSVRVASRNWTTSDVMKLPVMMLSEEYKVGEDRLPRPTSRNWVLGFAEKTIGAGSSGHFLEKTIMFASLLIEMLPPFVAVEPAAAEVSLGQNDDAWCLFQIVAICFLFKTPGFNLLDIKLRFDSIVRACSRQSSR